MLGLPAAVSGGGAVGCNVDHETQIWTIERAVQVRGLVFDVMARPSRVPVECLNNGIRLNNGIQTKVLYEEVGR